VWHISTVPFCTASAAAMAERSRQRRRPWIWELVSSPRPPPAEYLGRIRSCRATSGSSSQAPAARAWLRNRGLATAVAQRDPSACRKYDASWWLLEDRGRSMDRPLTVHADGWQIKVAYKLYACRQCYAERAPPPAILHAMIPRGWNLCRRCKAKPARPDRGYARPQDAGTARKSARLRGGTRPRSSDSMMASLPAWSQPATA